MVSLLFQIRSKLPVEHSSKEIQSVQLQHLHHMSPYLEMVILNIQVESIPQMVNSTMRQVEKIYEYTMPYFKIKLS